MKAYDLDQRTIGQILRDKARTVPEALYLRWEDDEYSYADADRISTVLAAGLEQVGLQSKAHVSILMDNCPDYLWLAFALGKLGAVAVPINTAAKGHLLAYFLDDADCTWAIVDERYADTVVAAAPQVRLIVRGELGTQASGQVRLADVYRAGRDASGRTPPEPDFTDPWFIMYTSGTTGPSKGVVCPHAHPLTVGSLVARCFELTPDDRMYTFLPLFHGNALWYSALTALLAEASIALVERFSASRFWADVHRYQATEFNAIMSVATILEKLEPCEAEQDNPLRLGFVVPLPMEREALERRWGLRFVCNYSMTEIVPAAVLTSGQGYGKRNSSGTASDEIEMRIVDEHDRPTPIGVPGEVVIRPREPWTTFTEYYGKPAETAKAFRNLWFHTGDRGLLDEDGHFVFVDRLKDAIRRRGENISAHEVEMLLELSPRIAEAAAVPVPAELGEDDVAVYVVREDSGLSEAEVIEYARENMAYFMVPRFVGFIDEIPKTPSHKKAKYILRERALEERDALWDREAHGIAVLRPGR